MARQYNTWTPEEEQELKDNYAELGAKGIPSLRETHSVNSIYVKASKLKLRYNGVWNERELRTLHRYYPEGGSKLVEEKLGHSRSLESIRQQAAREKVRSPRPRNLSP